MATTFEDIRPIVEGRLFEWGRYMNEAPGASISGAYDPQLEIHSYGPKESVQERWVEENWDALRVARVVEQAQQRLSAEQRALIEMRYRLRKPWRSIAYAIGCSERTAYRIRDEALLIVAYELDLLTDPESVQTGNGAKR